MAIPPIKPVYGVQGFTGQLVLPPGPQPPSPPIEGSMYASGGFVYIFHDGEWVEIGAGSGAETNATQYVHVQAVLATTWSVVHDMGKHPVVVAEDAGGTQVFGTVNYVSDTTLQITFARSATGKAICT